MMTAGARQALSSRRSPDDMQTPGQQASAAVLVAGLGRLRGGAAKFGQLLAQRPGALPDEYIEAAIALADQIPPMSYSLIKTQVLADLGGSPTELFASFDRQPLAAASLGQVHRATLPDGSDVAVKVQYPGIAKSMESDLANLRLLLPLLERIGNRDDLRAAYLELRDRLLEELDYRREAANCRRFGELFAGQPFVVPAPHPQFSGRRVLTLDLVAGQKLAALVESGPRSTVRNRFGRLLVRFTWEPVFRHSVMYVDPNPGNFLFRDDGTLGVVDFGCIKEFSPDFVDNLRWAMRAGVDGTDADVDAALEGNGFLTAATGAESRGEMRALIRMWAAPGRGATFDFGNRDYLHALVGRQNRILRDPSVTIPAGWLFYARQVVGITYLLYRLGAAGRFGSLFEELLTPPAEDAGRTPEPRPARQRRADA